LKVIDLTKPLDETLEIYADGAYQDPGLEIEPWCTIESQGYLVSKLCLGTQTGTHIDAPAHFFSGGATLDKLPVGQLIGTYFFIDFDTITPSTKLSSGYAGQNILFFSSSKETASLTNAQLEALIALNAQVWVIVSTVHILDESPLYFHQKIANSGVFLIEDLDFQAAQTVPPNGTLIALPLHLQETSGAPCRVIIVQSPILY